MKYIATINCFIGGRRIRAGEEFDLPSGVKPSEYMVKAEKYKKPTAKQESKEPETLAAMGQEQAKEADKAFGQ